MLDSPSRQKRVARTLRTFDGKEQHDERGTLDRRDHEEVGHTHRARWERTWKRS